MPSRRDNQNHPKLLAELGERVRVARKALGLSQERLADLIGMHRTYVGHVERGEANLTLISMAAIAQGLEMSLEDLTRGLTLDSKQPAERI